MNTQQSIECVWLCCPQRQNMSPGVSLGSLAPETGRSSSRAWAAELLQRGWWPVGDQLPHMVAPRMALRVVPTPNLPVAPHLSMQIPGPCSDPVPCPLMYHRPSHLVAYILAPRQGPPAGTHLRNSHLPFQPSSGPLGEPGLLRGAHSPCWALFFHSMHHL